MKRIVEAKLRSEHDEVIRAGVSEADLEAMKSHESTAVRQFLDLVVPRTATATKASQITAPTTTSSAVTPASARVPSTPGKSRVVAPPVTSESGYESSSSSSSSSSADTDEEIARAKAKFR